MSKKLTSRVEVKVVLRAFIGVVVRVSALDAEKQVTFRSIFNII